MAEDTLKKASFVYKNGIKYEIADLQARADIADLEELVNTSVEDLETAIDTKLDASTYADDQESLNGILEGINEALGSKVTQEDVDTTVENAIAALKDGVDESFDTMKEISDWIGANSETIADLGDKYSKPASGIPSTDLSEEVQASLSKADTALQEHQDISGKLNKSDLLSGINSINYTFKKEAGIKVKLISQDENQIFTFESYNPENTSQLWATGTAQPLGVIVGDYAKIRVLSNTVDSFVGREFYIIKTADANENLYDLYTTVLNFNSIKKVFDYILNRIDLS